MRQALALERNVVAASGAVFLLGFGEELWKKFLPKYMEALGAGALAIGLFGTAETFCDAVYQYPGGWLADRVGRRRAFVVFVGVASVGYLVYLVVPSWPWLFVGLALAMTWQSMGSPATFAVIGDALPRERRAMGFTLQSILRRIPMVISPLVGGALIAALGITSGLRIGFAVTLALAGATALLVLTMNLPVAVPHPSTFAGVWRSVPPVLRRLLVSDIVIRTCEGIAGVFIVLYVTGVAGVSLGLYGVLVAIQMTTSILVYLPAAWIADRLGRKPFVAATFLAFALFPVAVALAGSLPALVAAFVIGGLREIGEPARKAMIVDLADSRMRARTVGLYYLVRGLAVTPAAMVGGLLWRIAPALSLIAAGAVGLAGTIVFLATVEEGYAGPGRDMDPRHP